MNLSPAPRFTHKSPSQLGHLLSLGFALMTLAPGLALAAPLIIESTRSGQNSQMFTEVTGKWNDSSGKSTAPGITPTAKSRFVDLKEPPFDAVAEFRPTLPSAGRYKISVTWCSSGNAARVKYTVNNGTSEQSVYLDQDGWSSLTNKDKWVEVGEFDLPAKGAIVRQSAEEISGPASNGGLFRMYADAMQFELVGEGGSAAAPASEPPSRTSVASGASPFASGASAAAPAPATRTTASSSSAPSPFDSGARASTTTSSASSAPAGNSPFNTGSRPAAAPAASSGASGNSPFDTGAQPTAPRASAGASRSPFDSGSAPSASTGAASTANSNPFNAGGSSASSAPASSGATTSPFNTGGAASRPASAPSTSAGGDTNPFSTGGARSSAPPAASAGSSTSPFNTGGASSGASAPASAPSSGRANPFERGSSFVSGGANAGAPGSSSSAPANTTSSAGVGASSPFSRPAAPAAAAPTVATPPPTPEAPTGPIEAPDFQSALTQGRQLGRPIIVFFSGAGVASKKFEEEVLTQADAKAALAGFVTTKANYPDDRALTTRFQVDRAPTVVILGSDGYTRDRLEGNITARQLTTALNKVRPPR